MPCQNVSRVARYLVWCVAGSGARSPASEQNHSCAETPSKPVGDLVGQLVYPSVARLAQGYDIGWFAEPTT